MVSPQPASKCLRKVSLFSLIAFIISECYKIEFVMLVILFNVFNIQVFIIFIEM